jgi:hypothetical protein
MTTYVKPLQPHRVRAGERIHPVTAVELQPISVRPGVEALEQALRKDGNTGAIDLVHLSHGDAVLDLMIGMQQQVIIHSAYPPEVREAQHALAQAEQGNMQPILSSLSVQQIWHHASWRRGGRLVYDLDTRLARAFLETDLHITGPDLLLPVQSCYIAVPRELGLLVWNGISGEHPLDGFYVRVTDEREHVDTSPDALQVLEERKHLPVSGYGTVPEKALHRLGLRYFIHAGTERALHIMAVGYPRVGMESGDDAMVHFAVPLELPEVELEQWVTKDSASKGDVIGPNTDRLATWQRLVLNTLLYLSSEDPDVARDFFVPDWVRKDAEKTGSGKGKKRTLERHHPKGIIYSRIGSKIGRDLDANITRAASDEERRAARRCIVRGHWRRQAHGPERALRKTIWIKPFWRGESWDEVVARITKVTP